MNESTTLKPAFQAFRLGTISIQEIFEQFRNILLETNDAADSLLQEIDSAYEEDLISAQVVTELRSFVVNTITTTGENKPTDIDATRIEATRGNTDSLLDSQIWSAPSGLTATGEVGTGSVLRQRFVLHEKLGGGGMGTVYRGIDMLKKEARDRHPDVAVKVLNANFNTHKDAFIALQREASRQQRLAHPNIAIVYDFDRSGGVMFITMELLEGLPLDKYIKQTVVPSDGLPFEKAFDIIKGMAAALGHAHKHGIIHGDFKPANTFIASDGHVKVLDFAIARVIESPDREKGEETLFDGTHLGAMTPAYASPEMLEEAAGADPRDDIYALGCVSYQLLTGKHPMGFVQADKAKALALVPKRVKGLSRRQNDALLRAIAFDREQRTPTVDEFIRALSGTSAGLSTRMRAVYLGAAVGGIVVVASALWVPRLREQRQLETIISGFQSANAERIDEAYKLIDDFPAKKRGQVSLEAQPAILDFYRGYFAKEMQQDDGGIAYDKVATSLGRGSALFPDSASLQAMRKQITERRQHYLGELSRGLEERVATGVVEDIDAAKNIQDQLSKVAALDQQNPLLSDKRIPSAFAGGAEQAIARGDLAQARELLTAGLAIAADDLRLKDVADQLTSLEIKARHTQETAALAAKVESDLQRATRLADLSTIEPAVIELAAVDAHNPVLLGAQMQLTDKFGDEIAAIKKIDSLRNLKNLHAQRGLFAVLGLGQAVSALDHRTAELNARAATLIETIQARIVNPAGDQQSIETLRTSLSELAAIAADANDKYRLVQDVVYAYRKRSREYLALEQWQPARTQLLAAQQVADASLQTAIADDLAAIDRARQSAEDRLKMDVRDAERKRREDLIEYAHTDLTAMVAELSVREQSLREARSRVAALQALDPTNALLDAATADIATKVTDTAKRQAHDGAYTDALNSLALAKRYQFDTTASAALATEIRARQVAAQAAGQAAATAATKDKLVALIGDAQQLGDPEQRRKIAEQWKILGQQGAEASVVTDLRKQLATAYLATANALIEAQRLSAAGQLVEDATKYADDKTLITAAQARIAKADVVYRTQRAGEELNSRIAVTKQRFLNEVRANEPIKAEATLGELRTIVSANDAFLAKEAPGLLASTYANVAEDLIKQQDFTRAQKVVARGLASVGADKRLQTLRDVAELGAAKTAVLSAFSIGDLQDTKAVQMGMARVKALAPDHYADTERQWTEGVLKRLAALRSEDAAFNAVLEKAQVLLPTQTQLTTLKPLARAAAPLAPAAAQAPARPSAAGDNSQKATPAVAAEPALTEQLHATAEPLPPGAAAPAKAVLSADALQGKWCSTSLQLEFKSNEFAILVDGNCNTYAVTAYSADSSGVVMHWREKSNNMLMEFEQFASDGTQMVQKRGKVDDANAAWKEYARPFKRCP